MKHSLNALFIALSALAITACASHSNYQTASDSVSQKETTRAVATDSGEMPPIKEVPPQEVRGALRDVEIALDECLRKDDSNLGMKMCVSDEIDGLIEVMRRHQRFHSLRLLSKGNQNVELMNALQNDTHSKRDALANGMCEFEEAGWYGGTGQSLASMGCYVRAMKLQFTLIKMAWQVSQGVNVKTPGELTTLKTELASLKSKLTKQVNEQFKIASAAEKAAEDDYTRQAAIAARKGISKLRESASSYAALQCGLETDPADKGLPGLSKIAARQQQIRLECYNTVYLFALGQTVQN